MAFNWQTFRTRTLTAAVFVTVMLTGLLWNQWSFLILFTIVHFGCWWEYLKLVEKIYKITFHIYTKLGFLLIGYGLMTLFCGRTYQITGYGIKGDLSIVFSLGGFIILLIGIFQKRKIIHSAFGVAALGLIYISLSCGLMVDLYRQTDINLYDTKFVFTASFVPIIIVAGIWINDTMAYIVGSLIGKTQLSKISPQKTWEGTLGGILLCIVVIGFLTTRIVFNYSDTSFNYFLAMLAAGIAIFGTFGDLFESKLKRMAGVKDSGQIMPGHGGFLDRFDSMLFAIPFVWLYVYFFL